LWTLSTTPCGRLIGTIQEIPIEAPIFGGETMLAVEYSQDQMIEQSEVTLTSPVPDGTPVTVRPVQQSDVVLIQEMHTRLSKESVYYRYLAPYTPPPEDLQRLCFLDDRRGMAIVATVEEPRRKVIAMACYCVDPSDPTRAEPAILVEDSYQGRGLGKRMFLALCHQASKMGLEVFECFTHPANHRVLRLIESCDLQFEGTYSQGVREIQVWLKPVS
jgi:RimJ/RimL family protein N-acetyltransferase